MTRSSGCPSVPMPSQSVPAWSTWSTAPEAPPSLPQRARPGRRWSMVWRSWSARAHLRSSAGPAGPPPSRRGGSGRRLDDVVVDLGFVEREEMDGAVAEAQRTGGAPERVLLQSGRLSEEQLSRAVAERFGLDHVDLSQYRFDPNAAKLVTPAAVKRYQAIPVSFVNDRTLLVAMADPANV